MPKKHKSPGGEDAQSCESENDNTTVWATVSSSDTTVRLDDPAQVLIEQRLKIVYGEIVQQPVPEQLLKLLEELERKEQE